MDAPPGASGVEAGGARARWTEDGAVELHAATAPGAQGGAAFTGPVRFTCGPGRMRLGGWEERGLAGYSGGVRYRTTVTARSGPGVLDLCRVRGTGRRVSGLFGPVRLRTRS